MQRRLLPLIALLAVPTVSLVIPSLTKCAPFRNDASTGLTDTQVADVKARLQDSAQASWELGAEIEALLELEWPSLSVFGKHPFPFPKNIANTAVNASNVMAIVQQVSSNRPRNSQPLMSGSAVGDPPSLGYAFLLASYSKAIPPNSASYGDAASEQLNYLLTVAPRTQDGAISHCAEQVQLWADFIYMTPPFLAISAILPTPPSKSLLLQSYNQISLYRKYLLDPSTSLFRHIALGNYQDNSLWATGNAWAAGGMLRVMETMKKSSLSGDADVKKCISDLENWTASIVEAAWSYQQPSGALLNTLNVLPSESFPDSSSTAFFASLTFRLASLSTAPSYQSLIPNALRALEYIKSQIDSHGWLANVVNPVDFDVTGDGVQSAEGQAFVLLMHAAWRDWNAGIKG